ncbi:hypothetical protein FWD20_02855, partial [Candidatus Saccharibacteria bacterium]|nr:hypothetical protein [Candidatus Saccharibacteria bacterium]
TTRRQGVDGSNEVHLFPAAYDVNVCQDLGWGVGSGGDYLLIKYDDDGRLVKAELECRETEEGALFPSTTDTIIIKPSIGVYREVHRFVYGSDPRLEEEKLPESKLKGVQGRILALLQLAPDELDRLKEEQQDDVSRGLGGVAATLV